MQVKPEILAILDRAVLDGRTLTLAGQINRKTYQEVAKIIETAGGKWNRKAQAHVFEHDAIDTIEPILLTGEYTRTKQDFGQFDTPMKLAKAIVWRADIREGMMCLEPSAGIGNIVEAIEGLGGQVAAYEIDAKRLHQCKERCTLTHGIRLSDFLSATPEPIFDRVVMNPTFQKQADIAHVKHAAKFLKPDGRLISIMSSGITFRNTKLATEFRAFLDDHDAEVQQLPEGSFAETGTNVNAVVVSFQV